MDERAREEIIMSIIKTAIMEGKIYISSVETRINPYDRDNQPSITVRLEGDVVGKIELKSDVKQRVSNLLQLSQYDRNLDDKKRELKTANDEIERLKSRLARLHCLSNPE